MDSSHHSPASRPPRRGLHGNRPMLLRVHRGSHLIKKLPGQAPEGGHPGRPPPVIIHEVPPEVIHVLPEEFKETVQRLTGRSSNLCFEVRNEQVSRPEVPDLMSGEASTSTFRTAPSQPDISTGPTQDNLLTPSPGANQEFSIYDMYPVFDGDNPTTTYDISTPSQAFEEFFRF